MVNDDNPINSTRGGNNTWDRIFCLSLAEAERYFKYDSERRCQPTAHACNLGAWVDGSYGCCYWWLRSPGDTENSASYVYADGALRPDGKYGSNECGTVRPALRLIWNQ